MSKTRIFAFYLPQFHPFKENDEWWGKGFTEWTNVGKAKPLFKNHYQPKVPADLGYYDLRLPIVREQQAELAREAGVEGFCYWHYWFGNGKRLIPEVFDEVLASGKPDFPFCLAWANHSWYAKNWNADGSTTNKLLMEQTYPGIKDAEMHFEFLVRAFKDTRYIKVDGKPLFMIFDPVSIPDEYITLFKEWTIKAGFKGLYLVGNISHPNIEKEALLKRGFDAVTYQRLGGSANAIINSLGRLGRGYLKVWRKIRGWVTHTPPNLTDYKTFYPQLIDKEKDIAEDVIPTLVPNWDHTPRSGWNGSLFINSTPDNFKLHCEEMKELLEHKNNKIVFLKSWNEWGEGNYMEPDLKYGKGYIHALASVFKS